MYSEFEVTNPTSGRGYRVAIRGAQTGENYCACPDFATNLLGTCKHIECTLAHIALKRGGKKALQQGFHSTFSDICLDYAGQRRVRLRLGGECPATVRNKAVKLFLPQEDWQLPIDRYADLPAFLDAARKAGHAVRIYDDALNFIAEQRDAEHRRRSLDAAYPQGACNPALKNIVKIRLYPYQAEGRCSRRTPGVCCSAMRWGSAKRFKRSPRPNCSHATSGWNACSSSARLR